MPNQSTGCANKLDQFFIQWWDTAYVGSPAAGNKPQITGPGLAGGGFYDANGGCSDYGTDVPGTPGATVPATLALTLGAPATFSTFTPGVASDYTASTTATIVSTAGDATLTSSDPGRLINGAFSLPQPLQVTFSKSSVGRPGLQRDLDDHVQAVDRRHRRAAHGHVQQDADVHPEHDDPVGKSTRAAVEITQRRRD